MTLTAPDPEPELEQNYPTNISPPPYDQHKDGKLYKILIDKSYSFFTLTTIGPGAKVIWLKGASVHSYYTTFSGSL